MDLLSWTDRAGAPEVAHEIQALDLSTPLPICKLVDAVDFFRPEIIAHFRRVGAEPHLHNKKWEYALQLWDQINNKFYPKLPHVLFRNQPLPFWGTYGGTVSVALGREDRGVDMILEDPGQQARLQPLFEMGRRLSRRLTLPTRWW